MNGRRTPGTREIELLQSVQATDRFTRAIEHLGSEILPVRMGGICALERMARDLADDPAYIVDTLAEFVRERQQDSTVGNGGYVPTLQVRAPDAQAAITVLCRSRSLTRGLRVKGRNYSTSLALTFAARTCVKHVKMVSIYTQRDWKGLTFTGHIWSIIFWTPQTLAESIKEAGSFGMARTYAMRT